MLVKGGPWSWVKGVFVQNFLFVQDNDPPDVARDTVALLDQYDLDVMDWIAMSPDMNPIEQVWDLLPIWPNCVKSWGWGVRTLVESIPRRLRAVLVAKEAALLIITLHRLFHDLSIHLICCFSRASRGPYIRWAGWERNLKFLNTSEAEHLYMIAWYTGSIRVDGRFWKSSRAGGIYVS